MTLSPYLMTVALHALLLSSLVVLSLLFLRPPARRAAVALGGVLGIALLPWLSALLPAAATEASAPLEPQAITVSASWRVITIPAADFSLSPAAASPAAPVFTFPSAWTLAAWVWLVGSVLLLAVVASGLLKLRLWRTSFRMPSSDESMILEKALPAGLRFDQIRLSGTSCSPCVLGFIRPLLVLPAGLLESSSPQELAWILRHEQGHLLGRDSRWTLLVALSRALFWWNPLVHHLAKRWEAAREEICDLHAESAERADYGDFLIRMAAACKGPHMLAAPMVGGAKRRLRKRLVSFLNAPEIIDLRAGRDFIAALALVLPLLALCSSCVRIGGEGEQVSTTTAGMPPLLLETGKNRKAKEPHLFVKLNNRILATARPLSVSGAVLEKSGTVISPDQLQKLMVEASTIKGSPLISFPAISLRNGEKCLLEMIREKPPVLGESRVTAGWELQQAVRYDGKSLRIGNHIRYAFVPGKQFSFSSRAPLDDEHTLTQSDWKKLVVKTAASEAKVPESHAVITILGEVTPGMHTILITEVIPIDATGRTVDRYRDAIFTPRERDTLPGEVHVNATLLSDPAMPAWDEVPKSRKDMPVTRFGGLFTSEQWGIMTKELSTENLGTKSFSTGMRIQPWKQLPQLQLEAVRYRQDAGLVSLTLAVKETGKNGGERLVSEGLTIATGSTVTYRLPAFEGQPSRNLALTMEAVE